MANGERILNPLQKALVKMGLGFIGGGEVYPEVPEDLHFEGSKLVFTEEGSNPNSNGRLKYEVKITPKQKSALKKVIV
jgi:hypothetical protein